MHKTRIIAFRGGNKYREKSISEIIEQIENADDELISEVIQAVIRRYQRVFPGWEVVFDSLPKDDIEQRRKRIDGLIAMLNREKQE